MHRLDTMQTWVEDKGFSDTSNSEAIKYHQLLADLLQCISDEDKIKALERNNIAH